MLYNNKLASDPWRYMTFIWPTLVDVLVLAFIRTTYEREDGTGTYNNSINAPAGAGASRR